MKNFNHPQLLDIIRNYSPVFSNSERLSKLYNACSRAIRNPEDADAVSEVNDLSSLRVLNWIKVKMESDEQGSIILNKKLRIKEDTINMQDLANYDKDTLGYKYHLFMSSHYFSPNSRPMVKYIPDIELAYVGQRYKEIHDFFHVLLDYDISVVEELAVKWFEGLHLALPSASISGLFGPYRLSNSERALLLSRYIPHAAVNARNCKFLMNYPFEENLTKKLEIVRKELNIIPITKFL